MLKELIKDTKKDIKRQKLVAEWHQEKIDDGEEMRPTGEPRQPQIERAEKIQEDLKDFLKFLKNKQ